MLERFECKHGSALPLWACLSNEREAEHGLRVHHSILIV
jgi:hypothetical protein